MELLQEHPAGFLDESEGGIAVDWEQVMAEQPSAPPPPAPPLPSSLVPPEPAPVATSHRKFFYHASYVMPTGEIVQLNSSRPTAVDGGAAVPLRRPVPAAQPLRVGAAVAPAGAGAAVGVGAATAAGAADGSSEVQGASPSDTLSQPATPIPEHQHIVEQHVRSRAEDNLRLRATDPLAPLDPAAVEAEMQQLQQPMQMRRRMNFEILRALHAHDEEEEEADVAAQQSPQQAHHSPQQAAAAVYDFTPASNADTALYLHPAGASAFLPPQLTALDDGDDRGYYRMDTDITPAGTPASMAADSGSQPTFQSQQLRSGSAASSSAARRAPAFVGAASASANAGGSARGGLCSDAPPAPVVSHPHGHFVPVTYKSKSEGLQPRNPKITRKFRFHEYIPPGGSSAATASALAARRAASAASTSGTAKKTARRTSARSPVVRQGSNRMQHILHQQQQFLQLQALYEGR